MNQSGTSRHLHFIGAGGVGMSGLAKLLLKDGARVTGSDQMRGPVVEGLKAAGANIKIGHDAGYIDESIDAVVISAAVKESNPELAAAREKGIKVYKYAQMLGELMDSYDGVAVCGTHGKSTTCGWLNYVLEHSGENPNFIVGADVPQLGGSSGAGGSRWFIAEACEYDRSFLNLHPQIGVILNIEQDHLDYYKDEGEIVEAFAEFIKGVRQGGTVIANGEDANVKEAITKAGNNRQYITFGVDGNLDYSAKNIELVDGLYHFDICREGKVLGRTGVSLPGKHNILNALAVTATAILTGAETEAILEHLGGFSGIDRRLMLKTQKAGITILDDYAHHPTEIRASLEAMRERFRPERLWCVFQPHQYSRTRFLLDDFAESFKLADITIVPEIYFVRDTEETKRQVNAQVLVDRICESGSDAVFIDNFGRICEYLKENVKPGDLVVTMGAGDIWKVADEYIQWLRDNS